MSEHVFLFYLCAVFSLVLLHLNTKNRLLNASLVYRSLEAFLLSRLSTVTLSETSGLDEVWKMDWGREQRFHLRIYLESSLHGFKANLFPAQKPTTSHPYSLMQSLPADKAKIWTSTTTTPTLACLVRETERMRLFVYRGMRHRSRPAYMEAILPCCCFYC